MRSKKTDESFLEYKKRVLDTKSASFCGAKWYNATIWLGSGQTTSCHHPLPHSIPLDKLADNPSAIHNTGQKKMERFMMQTGQRPSGCEYCWRIEDSSANAISDRPYKSMIYSEEELNTAFKLPSDTDVNLRTLEIAFDRTCNFACSYCNPAFSTTWVKDIKNNGPYNNLVSDGRNHFTHLHDNSQLYGFTDTNPYVEAFFKWWETDLHKILRELRITGGEPLMSGHTWKLLDWFKNNRGKSQTKLAINSNLGLEREKLIEFVDKIRDLPHVEVYTSCEAFKEQADYIRDGLNYYKWFDNLVYLQKSGAVKQLHVMATINGLCLLSLPDFLEHMMDFKMGYGRDSLTVTLNILRFPSFQSPVVMPYGIKEECAVALEKFLEKHEHGKYLHQMEIEHVKRLVQYLRNATIPHEGASHIDILERDFKNFYEQYDQRRSKDFIKTFPVLEYWYNGL
ncbi:twitch domain-containing radical SAM protein [bacterium]|nr:twitch domain-containing radical SAM protein [bacterium]